MADIPQEWRDFIAPVVARAGRQRFRRAVRDARKTMRESDKQCTVQTAFGLVRSGEVMGNRADTAETQQDLRELLAVTLTAAVREAPDGELRGENRKLLFTIMGFRSEEERPKTIDDLVGGPFEHALMPGVTDSVQREDIFMRKFQVLVKKMLESGTLHHEEIYASDATGMLNEDAEEWQSAKESFCVMSDDEKERWRAKVRAYPAS